MVHRVGRVGLVFALSCTAVASAAAQEVSAEARDANRRGLAEHRRERFEAARAHFERALTVAPDYPTARFNAACAAARAGDLEGATVHVWRFVEDRPAEAIRVLKDEDLASLWEDEARMARIRRVIRPAGSRVREIVFERRDVGDLFAVTDDGLDERRLTETEVEEREVRFALDGRALVYIGTRGTLRYGVTNVSPTFDAAAWTMNQDLVVRPYPQGDARVIATFVQSYRLMDDGRTVLFVARDEDGSRHLRRVALDGGEPENLAEVSRRTSQFCFLIEPEGGVLLAEGAGVGHGTLSLRVSRLGRGDAEVLLERPRNTFRDFTRITRCELTADRRLDLGPLVVHLGGEEPRATGPEPDLLAGRIAEHVDEQHDCSGVDGDSVPPVPAIWKVSPLSWPFTDTLTGGCGRWSSTAVFRYSSDGGERTRLTPERTLLEYAPALASGGDVLVRTRLSIASSRPWLVLSAPDGSEERNVTPGQFAVWSPHEHTVAEAGQAIEFGPSEAPTAESAPEPESRTPAPPVAAAPAAPPAASPSGCGCSLSGRSGPAGVPLALLVVACVRGPRRLGHV